MNLKRTNKKRNSGLLMEFLIRHISRCLMNGKKEDAQKAVALSTKYFSEGTPLNKELSLFGTILKANVKTRDSAQKILDSVCRDAEKMNVRILDEQKSKLIKDINHTLKQEDFYDAKIPNYTVYSSLQTLLNEARNKNKTLNIADKVRIEENISEYLIRNPVVVKDPLKTNPNYNNAVYGFLMQRFHKKYEGKLNESQKKLLTQYALYLISNKQENLKESISKEISKIKNSLMSVKDDLIQKDVDLMKKINECRKKFSSFSVDEITEQKVLEILQYMKLVEEVES